MPLGQSRLAAHGQSTVSDFALASSPRGDVLLVWYSTQLDAGESYPFYVTALGADGSARGAPTHLPAHRDLRQVRAIVDPSGTRALSVYAGAIGAAPRQVHALPLTCAPD